MHLTDNISFSRLREHTMWSFGSCENFDYITHDAYYYVTGSRLLGAPWREVFERKNGGGSFWKGSERVRSFCLLLQLTDEHSICNLKKLMLLLHVMLIANWNFLQLRGCYCSSGRGSAFFFTSTKMPLIKTHKPTILAPRYADEFFCSNDKVEVTTKRCSFTSPDSAPPHKSPRIENQYPTIQKSNGEELSETDQRELKPDNTDESSDHAANPSTRKSLRRSTMTRRSVPALSSQHQRETFWGCCTFRIKKKVLYIVLHDY